MCDICEYRRSHVSLTIDGSVSDSFYKFNNDVDALDGAFLLTICKNGSVGEHEDVSDQDAVFLIRGSRRVGLYCPDTMVREEAEAVVEFFKKEYCYRAMAIVNDATGWLCGTQDYSVVYALDEQYFAAFTDERITHQARGLLLGYTLESVLTAYPNWSDTQRT
jgi:hypothetical protein